MALAKKKRLERESPGVPYHTDPQRQATLPLAPTMSGFGLLVSLVCIDRIRFA
jgi:hypothetical protein